MARLLHSLLSPHADPPEGARRLDGWPRALRVSLRAAHVLGAGVVTGGVVFGVESVELEPWLILLVAAGGAALVFDVIESPAFLIQTKGVVVVAKLVVLGVIVASGSGDWLLAPILFASVLSSHAPSAIRHRVLLFGDRFEGRSSNG